MLAFGVANEYEVRTFLADFVKEFTEALRVA
jgi:hypothetical protein